MCASAHQTSDWPNKGGRKAGVRKTHKAQKKITKNKPFGIPRHRWDDTIKTRIKGMVWCARICMEFISAREWD